MVTRKQAAGFVSGSSIMWAALVSFGTGQLLKAWAFGFVGVLLELSDVQVDLLTGFAEFLSTVVTTYTMTPTRAVRAAWAPETYQIFGVITPLVVTLEILGALAVGAWAVRRL